MSASFLTLTFRLPREMEPELPLVLNPWPVLGCEVRDMDTDVEVVLFLRQEAKPLLHQIKGSLQQLGAQDLAEGLEPEVDWLSEYRKNARPFAIGSRFWIDPQPQTPSASPAGRLTLFIEPRQAFGTGSHESTQLVLLLLEAMPPVGRRVLDVGTGSGILALAAKALGAKWVLGFDVDPDAIFVAKETAQWHQGWPVTLFAGPSRALRAEGYFDLVMVNMLLEQFMPLLPRLRTLLLPQGRLFLSGFLLAQQQAVESELANLSLGVELHKTLGEWAALVAVRS
ncbi:MAG: 50S ribosomal protein L11 methyltransferase [Thermoanaerobaculaceae bacterium]